jgi:hypothetical protein
MTRNVKAAASAIAASILAGCSYTGVKATPTWVPARLVTTPAVAPPPLEPIPQRFGANAVAAGMRGFVVTPTDRDVLGTTWTIRDVDSRYVYRVPTAPMAPTTILLPENEALNSAVSGSTEDFTIAAATSGARAAVTVMPNCANPQSKRFDTLGTIEGYEEKKPLLQPCQIGTAKATFLTSGGPYNFEFVVHDYTAVALVEVNHAPPPRTNPKGVRVPFPEGQAQQLVFADTGEFPAPWMPLQIWADPVKMVVKFRAPLPTWPTLFAGEKGEQIVNYRVVETPDAVYYVTDRRVTEAQLRIEREVVQITAKPPKNGGA